MVQNSAPQDSQSALDAREEKPQGTGGQQGWVSALQSAGKLS